MKFDGIDIDFTRLGAYFANLNDEQQAAFFTGMARELQTWGSQYCVEMQLSCIADKIPQKDREYLDHRGFSVFKVED